MKGSLMPRPIFTSSVRTDARRNKGKFRLSSFILARVRVDRQGQPVDSAGRPAGIAKTSPQAVETTYRVSDWLKRSGRQRNFSARIWNPLTGLNIEGIAVQGDTIWFGLRAPRQIARKPCTKTCLSGRRRYR